MTSSNLSSVNLAERLRAFGDDATLNDTERVLVWDAADEIERLRAEVAAFRAAIRNGDGPSCEDVCLRECIGVCDA